ADECVNFAKTPHHLDVAIPLAIPALLPQPRLGTNFGLDLLCLPHDAVDVLLRREVFALLMQVRTEVRSDPSNERDNEQGRQVHLDHRPPPFGPRGSTVSGRQRYLIFSLPFTARSTRASGNPPETL